MTTTREEEPKAQICKHCEISYSATPDNFYKCRGRLDFSRCKECKKEYSRENRKLKPDTRTNRKRDRSEYMRLYRLKKKFEKGLEDSKVK